MTYLYNLDAAYGASIQGDTTAAPALTVKNGAAAHPVVKIERNAAGSQTIGLLKLGGSSLASGAIIEFAGGFVSCTSVVLTSVANTDYCIPVQVGKETRYIPTFKAAAIVGGATF